ncbi:MAG: M12 family metallopeptidase [Polyangiaceae bacterium]
MKFHVPQARTSLSFALGVLLLSAGCEVGSSQRAARYPTGAPPGPMQQAAVVGPAGPAESVGVGAARQRATAPLYLPGSPIRQLVNYDVVNGMAVMEGDILLGSPQTLAFTYGMPRIGGGGMVKGAVTLKDSSYYWPGGNIPYVIDSSVSAKQIENIKWAIAQVNETELNVQPRGSEKDYVIFRDAGADCSSYLGRIGGGQGIQVGGCAKGSIIHEMLHAAGFYHEQSRGDRDEYITVVWDEIVPEFKSAFEKRDGRGQDIGAYDFGSVMHYSERAFSKSGKPTIITKVPGTPIGQRNGLSAGDKAAITTLYGNGSAPPPINPTTGPTTGPTTPPTTGPTTAPTGFAGNYTSQRGNVSCTESGGSVSCQYPGGMLLCASNGNQLDCGWSGGGQGRAMFQRQSDGVLKGSYGDFFSANSRGAWDLVPAGASQPPPSQPPPSQPPPSQPPPSQPPPSQPPQPPPAANPSLSGTYSTTRGAMNCSDGGSTLTCSFRESSGAVGRLDCAKDQSGLRMSCGWITYPPQPASGRALFTRPNTSTKNFTGSWGMFFADSGGGRWDLTAQ